MKHISLYAVFYLSLVFPWLTPNQIALNNEDTSAESMMCTPACQILDSLVLVEFYNQTSMGACPATGPTGWNTNDWIFTDPVCSWPGVVLDNNGYVVSLVRNNNGLTGNIPIELSSLSQLEVLFLSNNCLTGSIPTELGTLTNLTSLFLDGNELTGSIPPSLCNLVNLNSIFFDENGLTGTIPECFNNLDQLLRFDIYDNCIDSIPDLSGMLSMQPGKFTVYNNKLTFDDILPNLYGIGTFYEPQDSFCIDTTVTITTGSTYLLDLKIDAGIPDNSYQWYKNGVLFGAPTNSNTLVFSPVTFAAAGVYHCQVTNPNAPDLTLQSRCKTVNVICGTSTFNFTPDVCAGYEIIINGVTYNSSNPCDNTTLPGQDQYGCDSIINVCLNFITPTPFIIDTTLCPGESIFVNGTEYDVNNDSGLETIGGTTDMFNCDSMVQVDVSFFPPAVFNYEPTICLDDTIVVEGQEFHFSDSTGQIIIGGSSFYGCDSIINIDLNFWPLASSLVEGSYCDGQDININGSIYNSANPSGADTLFNGNWRGCDSIVIVNLTFGGGVDVTIDDLICEGQSIIVNGSTYDCDNLTGTETIIGGSYTGCDSIITVDLSCYQPPHGSLDTTLCSGDSLVFNGTTYNGGNNNGEENLGSIGLNGCDSIVDVQISYWPPAFSIIDTMLCANQSITVGGNNVTNSGLVVLENASFHGCDSSVFVTISLLPSTTNLIDDVLCPGSSIIVNGVEYDQDSLQGTEIIVGGNMYGCDSIITIDISYGSAVINESDATVCLGDSLDLGGTLLHENNLTYSDTIIAGSEAGCDSITIVNLLFYPEAIGNSNPILCFGESLLVNGDIIDIDNPTYIDTLEDASIHGCDSIVNIAVTFYPEATGTSSTTLCFGDSLIIDGITVDVDNPTYMDTLVGASFQGCDSIVTVNVSFYPEIISNISPTLCPGDSLLIGAEVIDINNPTDTIIFSGASFQGCDSTIIVNAIILNVPTGNYSSTLCPGDSIIINGTTYNETNLSGIETIPLGSFDGCDTTFTVLIDFFPVAVSNFTATLCDGESLDIGGVIVDASNPSDTVVYPNASFNGCDSLVIVNLDFYPPATELIDNTLCFGQSIIVNGTVYNETMPSGTETLIDSSYHGCDSIITIDLTFNNSIAVTLDPVLCDMTTEIIVNNVTYNKAMPSGMETMTSYTGCDSIVTIDLFYPDSAFVFHNNILCPGDSIIVNGVVYNEAIPQGQEVIPGASLFGCDVYHIIDLNFHPLSESFIDATLCFGEDTLINGVLFDTNHTTDTLTLSGAAYTSCDSFVIVNIGFYQEITYQLDSTLCDGQFIIVNGTQYDNITPTGTEVLSSYTGCDSTVNINLTFGNSVINNINQSICEGDSITINSIVYHMGNPTGTDTIPDGSLAGCDSVLNIVISFIPPSYNNIDTTLCPGEELLVNGIIYDSNNNSGADTLFGQSYTGCDSILNVVVDYFPLSENTIDTILCAGDSLLWNGMIYDPAITNITDTVYSGGYTGCDSIIYINIDFYDLAADSFHTTLCSGDSIIYNGFTFDEENNEGEILIAGGSYTGCDSMIFVSIDFYPLSAGAESVTICEGEIYEWNGQSYDITDSYDTILAGQSYTGCDSMVTLNLTVQTAEGLGLADAGIDFINCSENITLAGNQPIEGTGAWTIIEGTANIENPENAETIVNNMQEGDLSFVWTLSSPTCPNYDADTINIFMAAIPDAQNDYYIAEEGITLVPLNLLDNDIFHSINNFYHNILNPPTGELQDLGDGQYNYIATEDLLGTLVTFQYELCNEDCPESCDTALVSIQLQAIDIPDFPNTITANGDGVNDLFVIPDLEENGIEFPTQELIIFNRWGDIVYQAKPYQNDWDGTNENGKELPQGTYYYILRLDVGEGIIYRGDVTILR